MTDERTAEVASNMFGDKLYQQRARQALPLLIRFAYSQSTVTYAELARQLEMSNARNLNYVLGSIGVTLKGLENRWDKGEIPRIALLVFNKAEKMPGDGVDVLLAGGGKSLTKAQRKVIIKGICSKVFSYAHWPDVLSELGLVHPPPIATDTIEKARHASSGESEEHRRLKEAIAANPMLVGLPKSLGQGEIEFPLPSGDVVDVLFRKGNAWVAVEVKSSISNEADIARGLFQCIKYDAVLNAWRSAECESADVRVVLATHEKFPEGLQDLKANLGIEVVDEIRVNQ